MKSAILGFFAALGLVLATSVGAAEITLTPANPQPSGLKKGLKVWYFTGDRQVRSIGAAKSRLKSSRKPGAPLPGLSWPDKGKGAKVLTSGKPELVAADIRGYIKFPAAGTYQLEFWTNDGMEAYVGGQLIAKKPGITACASAGRPMVKVPKAGYYDIQVYYFQKEGTACLEMEWTKPGSGVSLVPNSAFFHK